ncbi:hypothetical protein AK812_SmicGene23404 [Symbiodinium microadriaticum]|uniref:Uncharacterized protein n=1 Tax=Symbiodinium microadriaticum TaxID=2951 RepID=A0A1Q9DHC0_SYMMI|nr:hypothetical protein AK812_SmicGene23404 [Symbiodinium microadriaticum]
MGIDTVPDPLSAECLEPDGLYTLVELGTALEKPSGELLTSTKLLEVVESQDIARSPLMMRPSACQLSCWGTGDAARQVCTDKGQDSGVSFAVVFNNACSVGKRGYCCEARDLRWSAKPLRLRGLRADSEKIYWKFLRKLEDWTWLSNEQKVMFYKLHPPWKREGGQRYCMLNPEDFTSCEDPMNLYFSIKMAAKLRGPAPERLLPRFAGGIAGILFRRAVHILGTGQLGLFESQDVPSVQLNNGVSMPVLAFAAEVWDAKTCLNATAEALAAGFRFAQSQAVRNSGLPRAELFIAGTVNDPKCSDYASCYKETRAGAEKQFQLLDEKVLDMLMLDYPAESCRGIKGQWQVSNFNLTQLQCATSWEFVTMEPEVPAVSFGFVLAMPENQMRFAVGHGHDPVLAEDAYSPLAKGKLLGMLVLENAQCLAKSACDFSGMLQAKLNRRSICSDLEIFDFTLTDEATWEDFVGLVSLAVFFNAYVHVTLSRRIFAVAPVYPKGPEATGVSTGAATSWTLILEQFMRNMFVHVGCPILSSPLLMAMPAAQVAPLVDEQDFFINNAVAPLWEMAKKALGPLFRGVPRLELLKVSGSDYAGDGDSGFLVLRPVTTFLQINQEVFRVSADVLKTVMRAVRQDPAQGGAANSTSDDRPPAKNQAKLALPVVNGAEAGIDVAGTYTAAAWQRLARAFSALLKKGTLALSTSIDKSLDLLAKALAACSILQLRPYLVMVALKDIKAPDMIGQSTIFVYGLSSVLSFAVIPKRNYLGTYG